MSRGLNDGFKVNTQSHLLPVLATSIKVILDPSIIPHFVFQIVVMPFGNDIISNSFKVKFIYYFDPMLTTPEAFSCLRLVI